MEGVWPTLLPEEKLRRRFDAWQSPQGVEFNSPEAEREYKARVARLIDAIQLAKTPDRVPVLPNAGFYPALHSGFTVQEVMNDYDKLVAAWSKFVLDFQPDAYTGGGTACPAKAYDLLDYKLYDWPGHGVKPEHPYQCVEAEYMRAEDYDALIQDPSDFWLRTYLPRVFGALEPLTLLSPLTDIVEMPFTTPNFIPYGLPQVRAALEKLLEAGEEASRWGQALARLDRSLVEAGFPKGYGGATKAPFDVIGDTLRGTRATMLDMYRRPEKLLRALDRITPLMIRMGVPRGGASHPIVYVPLHKGADGFMSLDQFKTFYWPTLRQVILGLIDEGVVPMIFAEGGFNTRLEVIRDLPKGKVIWYFDNTDMARAKEVLGDVACIMGNVPAALLQTGTVEQMVAYCKELIDAAGKGGGFILSQGASAVQAKAENLAAMVGCARDYGAYS